MNYPDHIWIQTHLSDDNRFEMWYLSVLESGIRNQESGII